MNKRIVFALLAIAGVGLEMQAQRQMDVLDRGLVAVPSIDGSGILCTWRITGDEWYGVKYNIYRDGVRLNDAPLEVSNYVDAAGTASSSYTVTAVVNGVEQAKCTPATPWETNYKVIVPQHDPSLTSTYVPNDATCADVDGDGELEIIMKYDNSLASGDYFVGGYNGEYTLIECLKLDGTVLWWINCGPNMGDFQNNEINIMAYDWDGDGRAEVVFRAADGTTIHCADGTVYTVGDPSINYRVAGTDSASQWFMCDGAEYLIYADGQTGKPYQDIEYPLKRVEDEDNPQGLLSGSAYRSLVNSYWGDSYGHRSSKYFFGAPYLDGRNPSIFLARGIYTHHKMIAYDVDPATHELSERWRWYDTGGSWYGQGYHNYTIADVDMDGRDEIVFGSMVIDDNGLGLSTTGLGHGDSMHVGDLDPYSWGLEVWACLEDEPNNNLRDATTSKIYYRTTGSDDDGRALAGNFINEYPGCQALSSKDDALVSCVSHKSMVGDSKSSVSITQNFRIYWDGDLLDESFDYYNGKNTAGAIYKAREGRIALLTGSKTNNDTKGTPCYQGDILGDWREEVMMRDADNNIRVYTTDYSSPYRMYTLWHDHQYRQAMVWQMCGYNQTPHVSYFVGELEGITTPPAPLMTNGRTELSNGATIGTDASGQHLIMCQTGDMAVNVAEGACPAILTVNAPSWVQGNNNNNNITYQYYTHTLDGGTFAGSMQLVKQGDGLLVMPDGIHKHTGATEVWAGSIQIDGGLSSSHLSLGRFTQLYTANGSFMGGIATQYGSAIHIGSDTAAGTLEASTLTLGFGSYLDIDIYGESETADAVKSDKLVIETKDWANGPERLAPTIRLTEHLAADAASLPTAMFLIGEIGEVEGNLGDILIEGCDDVSKALVYEDGKLYLSITAYQAGVKTWTGSEGSTWDLASTYNFLDEAGEASMFVPGDEVVFGDDATVTEISISGSIKPGKVTFNNDVKDYVLQGDGSIVGEASLVKEGAGKLTINNTNQLSGYVYLNGGTLECPAFANSIGDEYGALGDVNNRIYISNNAVLSTTASATIGQRIYISSGHATIDVPSGVSTTIENGLNCTTPGQILTKTGTGTLTLGSGNSTSITRLVINGGTVYASENSSAVVQLPKTVEFVKGTLWDPNNIYTYSSNSTNYVVEEGNTGTLYLDARCNYTGTLTGGGMLTVYATSVRNYLQGNWSEFSGTLYAGSSQQGSYSPVFYWNNSYGMPNATLSINSGTDFNAEGLSVALGCLSGSGTITTTGTLTVGSNNRDISFTGTYANNPTFVKVGTGDWKVTKLISGLRSITIKDGYLSLAPSTTTNTVFSTAITVQDNGIIRGRAAIGDLTIKDGGLLLPGYYTTTNDRHYGTIIANNIAVESGATASFYIRKANTNNSHSYVTVKEALTMNGTVTIVLDADYEPAIGDEFSFWTCSTFSGTPTLDLPELPTSMEWDTADLLTTAGTLRIVESAGIHDVLMDAEGDGRIYNLQGIEVKNTTELQPGIYIQNGQKVYIK